MAKKKADKPEVLEANLSWVKPDKKASGIVEIGVVVRSGKFGTSEYAEKEHIIRLDLVGVEVAQELAEAVAVFIQENDEDDEDEQ